jgi:N-acetylmuramic acid 6-phosphate (MurNAc-6-P) etherase
VRALGALTDLDRVGEHVFDAIEPAIRSRGVGGWVYASRSDLTCWLEVTALPSMTRQAAGAVDSVGIELKQMSTGLARKSAMLSGKMTLLGGAIELHEEPWVPPTWHANCQRFRSRQPTGGLTSVVYLFGGVESRAKNSEVALEHTEHREHDVFILVRASGE